MTRYCNPPFGKNLFFSWAPERAFLGRLRYGHERTIINMCADKKRDWNAEAFEASERRSITGGSLNYTRS